MNKKRLAIENFKSQLASIDNLYYGSSDAWKSYTREIIIKYLGPDSEFLSAFTGAYSLFTDIRYLDDDKRRAKESIVQCIRYIELNGTREESKQNFLYRLSETALWTIISLAMTGLVSIGGFFGNLYADKQNIELRQENKALKDSLSIIRLSAKPTNKIADTTANTIHKEAETKKDQKR